MVDAGRKQLEQLMQQLQVKFIPVLNFDNNIDINKTFKSFYLNETPL